VSASLRDASERQQAGEHQDVGLRLRHGSHADDVAAQRRWVLVWTPATLMTTSSAAPGRLGVELQLVTMSQKLVPPVQSTVAEIAGPVPAAMAAAIKPIVDVCNPPRMITLLAPTISRLALGAHGRHAA